MKKHLLLLSLFMVLGSTMWAQTTLRGGVVDAITSEPIVGASVRIASLRVGALTDAKGEFGFTVLNSTDSATLEVQYLGYKMSTQRISLAGEVPFLSFELSEDLLSVEEVVITGQGQNIERRRLSADVQVIKGADLENKPVQRLDQLLQAELNNVGINLTGGQPGTTSIMRGRSVVSASQNSAPIIFVDGIRVDALNTPADLGLVTSGNRHQGAATSAIPDIPVENIERIEYIHGGAAATLYGSDAANGVIQIITKKRGLGKANFSIRTEQGAVAPTKDFLFFDRTADLLFQTGHTQSYNIGVNGGNETMGYSASGTYLRNTGFRIHDQNLNERIDMRIGLQAQLADDWSYNSSFGFVNNRLRRVRNGNAGGYTGTWFTEAGSSLFTGPGFNNNLDDLNAEEFAEIQAYVDRAERLQNFRININRFQTSQTVEYTPIPGLVIKALGGVDFRVQRERGIVTNEYLNHTRATPEGSLTTTEGTISNFDRRVLTLTLEGNAQYRKDFGDFSSISVAGAQLIRTESYTTATFGLNVPDGAVSIDLAAERDGRGITAEAGRYGIYLQENFGFKNRYFIEGGVRIDENPAFGSEVGFEYYPKVGFSYLLSDESFFKNAFGKTFSYAKLRANYGITGVLPGDFAAERTIDIAGFQGAQAATFGQPGDENIRPERATTLEFGAELGFLEDRLSLSVSYYTTETEDALFVVPAVPSTGENAQIRNIGTIENQGIEIALNAVIIQSKDWNLRVRASLNTLDNEVTDAGGTAPFNINGFSSRTIQTVVAEGQPIGFLRGNLGTFDSEGVYQSTQALQPLGTTIPDLYGNFELNLRFRSLTLFANADYSMGAYAHSFDRQFRFRYGVDNEGISQAEIDANGRGNWLNFTDQFVEEIDFLKVRIVGLNYELPTQFLGGFAKGLNIGFTVTNPLNFASSSFDPEATQAGGRQGEGSATTGGIAYGATSLPREFVGSIQLRF